MNIFVPEELKFIEQELQVFFDAMVYKLSKNVHKGKWEDQNLETLASLLEGEVDELAIAINSGSTADILMEAADTANFAMMMADVAIKGRGPFASRAKVGQQMAYLEWVVTLNVEFCLPWPFRSRTGPNMEYGQIGRGQSKYGRRAHRVLCGMIHGDPPTLKHEACHSCGYSLCVNKNHVRWGTKLENEADKQRHGTHLKGEKATCHVLTLQQVAEIRNKKTNLKISDLQLSREYGISNVSINNIVKMKTWRNK